MLTLLRLRLILVAVTVTFVVMPHVCPVHYGYGLPTVAVAVTRSWLRSRLPTTFVAGCVYGCLRLPAFVWVTRLLRCGCWLPHVYLRGYLRLRTHCRTFCTVAHATHVWLFTRTLFFRLRFTGSFTLVYFVPVYTFTAPLPTVTLPLFPLRSLPVTTVTRLPFGWFGLRLRYIGYPLLLPAGYVHAHVTVYCRVGLLIYTPFALPFTLPVQ